MLSDSKDSLQAINDALQRAKFKILELKALRNLSSKENYRSISEEIDGLYKLRESLFPDKDALKEQRNNFLSEVKRLNNQTRMLKEAIRDRTGLRGKQWYAKLALRVAEKKILA